MEKDLDEREHIETLGVTSHHEDRVVTKWEAVKDNPKNIAWIGWAIFVLCLQGFDNQAGGIVVGIEEFRKDFGYEYAGNYVLPAGWQSAFSGGPNATAVFGSLFAGWLGDVIGRKWAIFLFLCNSFIGVALEYIATTNGVFFAGKMLNGLSLGAFNCLCVAYVSEISPLAIRGITTAMCNLSLAIGPLICVILGDVYGSLPNRWAYRGIFVAQWGFAGIAILFCPFAPESPWWHVQKGHIEKATQSLQRLGLNELASQKQLATIQYTQNKAQEETQGGSFIDCFRGTNLRRTILTIAPLTIQALSGVSFISFYGTYYFQLAGNSVERSFQLACGAQGLSILGNIASWFVIDRVGRRPLIFWGMCFLTVLLMITGGLATSAEPGPLAGTVALIMFYNFVFNLVIGSVAYTLVAEIPTTKLRGKTIGISLTVQQVLYTIQLFVLPYIFNPDKANLGAKTSFIFAGLAVICCVYLFFCYPETAHRSFQEIDEMFFKEIPARQFKSYVSTAEATNRNENA
ncbi:maltose permease [Xylariales sp. AK1849]|nr:maltose permease [Xylariales sp. AK1849]